MESQSWTQKSIGNKFIIENKILGRGQYGTVYQAWFVDKNKNQNKPIAAKVIDKKKLEFLDHEKPGTRDKTLKYIKREASIQIKVKNPYIVELFQVHETPNNVYFFLEYCEDGDMMSFLNKNKPYLSESDSIIFFKQICEAFKLLTKMKICHRDLKPHNILMHDGQLKIADFGFSKVVEGELTSNLNTQVGSPIYMSPQAIESQKYDPPKQDVWSAGIILYQMLYGKYPWTGGDINQLFANIKSYSLNFPEKPVRSEEIKELIRNMLQKNEADRWDWERIFKHPIVEGNVIEEKNMLNSSKLNIFTEKQQDKDLSKYEEMINKKSSQNDEDSQQSPINKQSQEQQPQQQQQNQQQFTEDQKKEIKLIHQQIIYSELDFKDGEINETNMEDHLESSLQIFKQKISEKMEDYKALKDRSLLVMFVNMCFLVNHEEILKNLKSITELNRYIEQFDLMDEKNLVEQIHLLWKF